MKKSAALNAVAAATLWTATSGLALANEGPEGMGDMQGPKALFMLLGGVAALGVVIWLMIKFLGRDTAKK